MFYLCIIIYVKVKFATSDLVSYLFNPCNFFLPIYSLYICIFFFFFVLYLQWIIIYIKNVFFGTFWCCICLPELWTSQCKPPTPRDISRHLREIFPYLTSERALGIGDFDALCTPSKNSGGMDHGIFHQGGLVQESLILQDGGYGVVCLFKFWSTFLNCIC